MLQIVETRILSVISFYHLAFFAISMEINDQRAGGHAKHRLASRSRRFPPPWSLEESDLVLHRELRVNFVRLPNLADVMSLAFRRPPK